MTPPVVGQGVLEQWLKELDGRIWRVGQESPFCPLCSCARARFSRSFCEFFVVSFSFFLGITRIGARTSGSGLHVMLKIS